jgi:hypothetical protein
MVNRSNGDLHASLAARTVSGKTGRYAMRGSELVVRGCCLECIVPGAVSQFFDRLSVQRIMVE